MQLSVNISHPLSLCDKGLSFITLIIELSKNIKGELIIVVEGNSEQQEEKDYEQLINNLIKNGYSKRDAIKEIADKYNISKNKLYNSFKGE